MGIFRELITFCVSLFLYHTPLGKEATMAHSKSALLRHFAEMEKNSDDIDVIKWAQDRMESVKKMSESEAKEEAYALFGKGRPAFVLTTGTRR
jgi:hypothetical protein